MYVLSYGISYIHLKSSWLTQDCLEDDSFSTFCLIWPNSISKKNGEKNLNFSFWIPLDPKPIFNDQVGSGPYAHTTFSSATRCKVSRGPKRSRKTDFQ